MKRRVRRILWTFATLLLLAVSGELFCRYYLGLGDPPLSRTDPEIEYLFVGPRTYHRFGNTIAYNSYSMRTREFDARRKDAGEIRVMVCGDSIINGGALTDQSQLMTTLLEEHLKRELQRPAVVMNVSAGSWGPPNYLAYVRRYGLFEANALVIVVSSHDAADSPTFQPIVGVSPDFPAESPTFALEEALMRYLPRYLPSWEAPPPAPMAPSQGQFDQAMGAFRTLVRLAQEREIGVIVAQHPERTELGAPESEGHRLFREACDELKVIRVDWSAPFERETAAGRAVYRDDIHPNVHGQEIMEQTLFPELLRAAGRPPSSSPAAGR